MQLRSGEHGRVNEALSKADAMLKAVAKKADETLRELGCTEAKQHEHGDNDEDKNEDADEEGTTSASPSATVTPTPTSTPTPTPTVSPSSSPATSVAMQMSDVADRAVAAMDTVLNAAKALVADATASPAPLRGDQHRDGRKQTSGTHDGGHRD